MKVLKRNSRQKKKKKQQTQGLETLVEVEHLPLSVWATQKSGPGSVMVICRQLRETDVFRRHLWINPWCLSRMGWMVPCTRLEGAPTEKLWFSTASITTVTTLLANAATHGWKGEQSRSKAGAGRGLMDPFGFQLGMLQTSPSPHKHSCSGCRDQEQPVDHLFGLSGHLERCCCELGVV